MRAPSRSTTWIQRAPARHVARGQRDRVAVALLPAEVALGQAHRRPGAQVDRRAAAPSRPPSRPGARSSPGAPARSHPTSRDGTGRPTARRGSPTRPPHRRSRRPPRSPPRPAARRSARSRPRAAPPARARVPGATAAAHLQGVPLHLRVLDPGGQRPDRPGEDPQARHAGALDRALVEQLEPHADPEEGHARRHRGAGGLLQAAVAQRPRAGAERAHPRQHHGVGRLHGGRVVDQARRRADVLERLLGRAEVADAVVEDGDARPPVTGCPWSRGCHPPRRARRRAGSGRRP